MRAELQKSVPRAAAQRQQNEEAAENLMEQLAIAQSVSADTQVSLLPCAEYVNALTVCFVSKAHCPMSVCFRNKSVLQFGTDVGVQTRMLVKQRHITISGCHLTLQLHVGRNILRSSCQTT